MSIEGTLVITIFIGYFIGPSLVCFATRQSIVILLERHGDQDTRKLYLIRSQFRCTTRFY